MKIQYIKDLKGTEKFGTCIECGKDTYVEKDIVRLAFGSIHKCSFCLCPGCLNKLIGQLRDNF